MQKNVPYECILGPHPFSFNEW